MATFLVTTNADEAFNGGSFAEEEMDGGGLSLREAIALSNASNGADSIEFSLSDDPLIRLQNGQITVTGDLTINGRNKVTINGDRDGDDNQTLDGLSRFGLLSTDPNVSDNSRLFEVTDSVGSFAIDGLTLTGGVAVGEDEGGGAIKATGESTLVTISNSYVSGNGSLGVSAEGGAVFAFGELTVENSTFSRNSTDGRGSDGGAIFARGVTIENSTIVRNFTFDQFSKGGGVYGFDHVTISNSTISGNVTSVTASDGGGVFSIHDISVSNSIVIGNLARFSDGNEIYESIQQGPNQEGPNDGLIFFSGSNLVGENQGQFDTIQLSDPTSTGTAANAQARDVFSSTELIGGSSFVSGAVSDNGGRLPTIALKANASNPALDASNTVGSDARGLERSVDLEASDNGGTSDLGAFELQADEIVLPPVDPMDPIVPVDPDDPVDPTDPVDPIDPTDPTAPTGPTTGDDTLLGTALNDTIDALAGNDKVTGLAGDDHLFGRGGDDVLRGSAGDDSLRGNGGDDTLRGNGGNDNIKGNGGEDFIRGNGGDDVIRAGGAADNVKGGGGADLIFGGGGADQLNGGGGADTLRGNGGDDTLKGNGGADVFQFRASDRNDTISDFRQGQDKIQIQSGANSFEALSIEQDGRDVLIGFGAGQVRVITDSAGTFDESDFIF